MKLLTLISISVILVSTILQYSEAAQTTSTISTRRKRIARRKLEDTGSNPKEGSTTKESTTKEPHDHSHAPKQMKKTVSPRPSVSISTSPSLSISPSVGASNSPSQFMSKQPSTSPSKSPVRVVTSKAPITSQYDEWEIPSNPDSCQKDSDCLMNYYCTQNTFICCSNDEICDSINIEKGVNGIGEEQEENEGLDKVKIIQYGMFGALVVGGVFMVMRNRRGGDI